MATCRKDHFLRTGVIPENRGYTFFFYAVYLYFRGFSRTSSVIDRISFVTNPILKTYYQDLIVHKKTGPNTDPVSGGASNLKRPLTFLFFATVMLG